jgi:undecaprenyl-diphosphatase
MNPFDQQIIHQLYPFNQHSPFFTSLMELWANNDFLNGGLLACFLWFFWVHPGANRAKKREKVIITVYGTFAAIVIGRILTNIFPFRMRPVLDATMANFYPDKSVATGMIFETSMPSDHAVMFFAMATGLFLLSKKLGFFAYLYSLFIICFPRVYLGLHYPSDIAVGAVIGVAIMGFFSMSSVNRRIINGTLEFHEKYPGYFYTLFFLVTYQIGTMFDSCRELLHFLSHTILRFS